MKIDDISNCFLSWGYLVRRDQLDYFNAYIREMLNRKRILAITNGEEIDAIISYFLTDNISKFENKPNWSTPSDSEDGEIMFIDKMVARKWTKSLRVSIYNAIKEKYPFVTQVIWLREPINRHVIINMRGKHELYSQIS